MKLLDMLADEEAVDRAQDKVEEKYKSTELGRYVVPHYGIKIWLNNPT